MPVRRMRPRQGRSNRAASRHGRISNDQDGLTNCDREPTHHVWPTRLRATAISPTSMVGLCRAASRWRSLHWHCDRRASSDRGTRAEDGQRREISSRQGAAPSCVSEGHRLPGPCSESRRRNQEAPEGAKGRAGRPGDHTRQVDPPRPENGPGSMMTRLPMAACSQTLHDSAPLFRLLNLLS